MSTFTSKREKYYWILSAIVLITIVSSLFLGQPLARELRDQNVQAVIFVTGMGFVGAAILLHSLRSKPSKYEYLTVLGIIAVYTMFFFRLGAPERSHLIEYSILAIFVHRAIMERFGDTRVYRSALIALVVTFLIGVIDESMQLFLPNRVFDPVDIFFNGIAATIAIGSNLVIYWIRKVIYKRKGNYE